MTQYQVWERTDDDCAVIAEIDGEKVTGPEAEMIEKLLRELGWPEKSPDHVLHGSRLWAADASKPIVRFGG